MTSFVSVDLHIRTTNHLLNRSLPIRIYGSPVTCMLCDLQEKSFCISWPSSVNTGSFTFSANGKWYFQFLQEPMHAVHVLHLFLMSFLIPGHQNIMLSASISFEAGSPKCSARTTCYFSSAEIKILSPATSREKCSLIWLKTGEIFSGALSFCLFLKHIFLVVTISQQPKFCESTF